MTCREKLKELNPLFDDKVVEDIVRGYCPFEWRIDYPAGSRCCHSSCSECWDHDVPDRKE